ncbi:MAG: hypothetical protein ACE5JK_07905 [Candidatus Omnitrophota bacterium]
MKTIIALVIMGMFTRFMIITPAQVLPKYPVMGTEKYEKVREETVPRELRHMSRKMYHLKTGRHIDTERNHKKQQNFWGKGIPSRVQFPAHLVMYEKVRHAGNTQKAILSN